MKFIHLSDLHIGKRAGEFSLLDDQRHILSQIAEITETEAPDAVLIAGDVYDKPTPPADAVQLFDDFLFRLCAIGCPIFVISGNHDSPERLGFGSRLFARDGVYISRVYDGEVHPVTLHDRYGELDVYLLPFVKPVHVRRALGLDGDADSYDTALSRAVELFPLDPERRNVLVTHQFVAGARRCESEELSVGGTDAVSAALFDRFDYVALGHLHEPQSVTRPGVRYCGSPLKYSFSEAGHTKSVTVAELREKGSLELRTIPLTPLHDMRELRGSYMHLTSRSFYAGTDTSDYLHITLTDEEDVPEALGRLRTVYPNLMKLDYDNSRTRAAGIDMLSMSMPVSAAERTDPLDLFRTFYERQNGREMSPEALELVSSLVREIWETEA